MKRSSPAESNEMPAVVVLMSITLQEFIVYRRTSRSLAQPKLASLRPQNKRPSPAPQAQSHRITASEARNPIQLNSAAGCCSSATDETDEADRFALRTAADFESAIIGPQILGARFPAGALASAVAEQVTGKLSRIPIFPGGERLEPLNSFRSPTSKTISRLANTRPANTRPTLSLSVSRPSLPFAAESAD